MENIDKEIDKILFDTPVKKVKLFIAKFKGLFENIFNSSAECNEKSHLITNITKEKIKENINKILKNHDNTECNCRI